MINEFIQHFAKFGYASPAMFVVEFLKVPSTIQMHEFVSKMNFICEGAELPGDQILYQEHRVYHMPEKYAYGKLHDELNLIFRVDSNFLVKRFLTQWVNSVYNPVTGDVNYKDKYYGTIRITLLDKGGKSVYAIELDKAYPIQIQPITLGWEQVDDYARLNTTFTFRTYREVTPENFFNAQETNYFNEPYFERRLKSRETTSVYQNLNNSQIVPTDIV